MRYAVYDFAGSQNVQDVSAFIRNKGFSDTFAGNWMLVAEWRDVPMFPGNREEVSYMWCCATLYETANSQKLAAQLELPPESFNETTLSPTIKFLGLKVFLGVE